MPPVRIPWKFDDGTETYLFDINPNEGGSPTYTRKINKQGTVAPDGEPVLSEGQAPMKESSASGVLRTRAQYAAFKVWAEKRTIIEITDDLGRVMVSILEEFEPRRVRKTSTPWYHTFTLRWSILSMIDADELV